MIIILPYHNLPSLCNDDDAEDRMINQLINRSDFFPVVASINQNGDG